MIRKLFRGYVEGVGSKTIAFVLLAIVTALVAPLLFKKFGIDPDITREILYGLGAAVAGIIAKQLVVDVQSGGATTTQYLVTKRALEGLEKVIPDDKKLDAIVKEVLLAMNRAQSVAGETKSAALPPLPPAGAPANP